MYILRPAFRGEEGSEGRESIDWIERCIDIGDVFGNEGGEVGVDDGVLLETAADGVEQACLGHDVSSDWEFGLQVPVQIR